MIDISKGKSRRNIDIPCQACGNPTSFRIEFAHDENPNAKTSIHICSICIQKLQKLMTEALKSQESNNAENYRPDSKENLTLQTQIKLWEEFSDYDIDENECITRPFIHRPFCCFPTGTHREEIWHWFEDNGPLSAYQLLYQIDDFK